MRWQQRTERSPRARRLVPRLPAALAAVALVAALAGCTPAENRAEPVAAPRETVIEVAASPEFTAAKEEALVVRDEAVALLAATADAVKGTERSALLRDLGGLNVALGGTSADAIVSAIDSTVESQLAVADRVLGLGSGALTSVRGSNARRDALAEAVEQLRAALSARSGLAPAAEAVLGAREPLLPAPGSAGAPPPRQPPPAPPAAPAPAPAPPASPAPTEAPAPPAPPAPEPEAPPAPAPEQPAPEQPAPEPPPAPPAPEPPSIPDLPIDLPPELCEIDARLCPQKPGGSIGRPADSSHAVPERDRG